MATVVANVPQEVLLLVVEVAMQGGWAQPNELSSMSMVCRAWRTMTQAALFRTITLRVHHQFRPLHSSEAVANPGAGTMLDEGPQILRHFHNFLMACNINNLVKKLIIMDDNDISTRDFGKYDDVQQEDVSTLVDVLQLLPNLRGLHLDALILVDAHRMPPDVVSRGLRRPFDLEYLGIYFWDEDYGRSQEHAVPRLLGLLSLFGRIKCLYVEDDLPCTEPFRHEIGALPTLPSHTTVSSLKFRGGCSHPTVMRTIVQRPGPVIASPDVWDVDGIVADCLEDLKALIHEPSVRPRHLKLAIYDPPETPDDVAMDLSTKASLKELSLTLPFAKDGRTLLVQSAVSLLHGLFPNPGALQKTASLQTLRILIVIDDAPPSLFNPAQDLADSLRHLDDTLLKLYHGDELVHEISVCFQCRSPGQPICRQLCALLLPKLTQSGSEVFDRAQHRNMNDEDDGSGRSFIWTRSASDGIWRRTSTSEDRHHDVSQLFPAADYLDSYTIVLRDYYEER